MDSTEIKVEMAEGGLLEPLVITEEGDISETVTKQSQSGESALKKEEKHSGEDKNEKDIASEMYSELENNTAEEQTGDVVVDVEGKSEESENVEEGQNTVESTSEGQTHTVMRIHEKPEKSSDTEDKKVTEDEPKEDIKTLNSSEKQPEDTQSQQEDAKKVCGLLFHLFTRSTLVTQLADHVLNKAFV